MPSFNATLRWRHYNAIVFEQYGGFGKVENMRKAYDISVCLLLHPYLPLHVVKVLIATLRLPHAH